VTAATGAPPTSSWSQSHQVKSIVGGPTAKSFNLNFASAYDEIDRQSTPPGNLYASDDEARETVEQLIRDAGYEPVRVGGLEQARPLEDHLPLLFAISKEHGAPVFYRYESASPPQ